jgi:hypothetical protein
LIAVSSVFVNSSQEGLTKNHCCCGKAISIKYYECKYVCVCVCAGARVFVCSFALLFRQAIRIFFAPYFIVVCGCLDLPYFSTCSHKQQDFRKKNTELKICVLTFSTKFICNTSHSEKNSTRHHKCLQAFMQSIAGIISQSLQLQTQVTLARGCAKSFAHISVYSCIRSGGDASIRLLT